MRTDVFEIRDLGEKEKKNIGDFSIHNIQDIVWGLKARSFKKRREKKKEKKKRMEVDPKMLRCLIFSSDEDALQVAVSTRHRKNSHGEE